MTPTECRMVRSCAECPQYVVKEIEPDFPAFCLYWGEGLLNGNSICPPLKEGRVPKERVTTLTDLSASSPYGLAGLEYCQSLKSEEPHQDCGDASQGGPPREGRHLVKIKQVRGYLHNFEEYRGPRARLRMETLEGPDAGRLLFDNVSLPHPKESKGMQHRRVRIAYHLGLIPWGVKGNVQINWKDLEGVVCWVDVAYKNFGGRAVPTIDNELMEHGARALHLTDAKEKTGVKDHHEPVPPPPLATCESCVWYTLNPWTRNPSQGAWCHYRMEHLTAGSPVCEEFKQELSGQPDEQVHVVSVNTTPANPAHSITCADCLHFQPNNGPNPRQGWGRCLKRNKGRFGCATACEAAITDDGL